MKKIKKIATSIHWIKMLLQLRIIKRTVLLVLLCANPSVALQLLSDDSLSRVEGRAGITLEQELIISASDLAFSDDGNVLHLENLVVNAGHTYVMDVQNNGALNLTTTFNPSTISVDDIRIDDGVSLGGASMGGLTLSYEGQQALNLRGDSAGGGFSGSIDHNITNAGIAWETNTNEVAISNMRFRIASDDFSFRYDAIKDARTGLELNFNNAQLDFALGAFVGNSSSSGQFMGELLVDANFSLFAGGRLGSEGLTFYSMVDILPNGNNKLGFENYDGSYKAYLSGVNGNLNLDNFTFDVSGDNLHFAFDELSGSLSAEDIYLGNDVNSVGAFTVDFLFNDYIDAGNINNSRYNYMTLTPGIIVPNTSWMPSPFGLSADKFYAGINSASQGLSIEGQWNLDYAHFKYTDNANSVIVSNLISDGAGDMALHVFDDGGISKLALGFDNVLGQYSIDGLKVGSDTSDLQGGIELLLMLEVFQSMDFTFNGYTYVSASGNAGAGKLSFDGDYLFSDTTIGLSVDDNDNGIWATGVDYEIHFRDVTLDVDANGLRIARGEQWSSLDIDDMRWGDKTTGKSMGRVKLERFEKDSELIISAGGAGALCVGATASDSAGCAADGGRWENRGNEGLNIFIKGGFTDAGLTSDGTTAVNRLTWENNRTNGENGTGTQIIFDNFSTNDGLGTTDTNNYGLRASLDIDVFETKVLKKSDGLDANGVTGSVGQELIYDNIEPVPANDPIRGNGYTYMDSAVVELDSGLQKLRPLGFAVQGNVSFKELNIGAIQLKHPSVATPETVFYGLVMQNFNLTTNLTATPIR